MYLIILLLCKGLDGGHEYVLVAEQVLQNQLGEAVPEAGVRVRVQYLQQQELEIGKQHIKCQIIFLRTFNISIQSACIHYVFSYGNVGSSFIIRLYS